MGFGGSNKKNYLVLKSFKAIPGPDMFSNICFFFTKFRHHRHVSHDKHVTIHNHNYSLVQVLIWVDWTTMFLK